MVGFPVVCPVCGAREELTAGTSEEVAALMACPLPCCPACSWAREEDRSDPVWDRLEGMYTARAEGDELSQSLLDRLSRR